MIHLIKIILFLLVNIGGYYTIPVLVNLTVKLGIFPQMPTVEEHNLFMWYLMGVGTWVWLGAAVASIGYFFASEKIRVWLILAPLYLPFLYGASTMIYFDLIRTQTG